mgnify:FL=1
MRRRALLGGVALGAWALQAVAAPARGDAVNWPAVTLLDGTPWPNGRARDSAVVVVFWSLTCPYCERHNAHVARLHRAAAGRPLSVLGAVRERDVEAVRRHMAQRGWSFPVTLDGAALGDALSPRRSVPLTVTVDRQGRLQEVIPGEMFEDDVMGFLKLAD